MEMFTYLLEDVLQVQLLFLEDSLGASDTQLLLLITEGEKFLQVGTGFTNIFFFSNRNVCFSARSPSAFHP